MQYAQPEKQAKDPCIIWWRIRALGFQQENQDWKEKSATFMKGSQLVLYQILHYSICASEGNSRYKNFSYNPKFQIQMLSGDIVTQTFVPSHKMVI